MAESRSKNATRNIISAVLNKTVNTLLPFITRTIIIYMLGSVYLGLGTLFSSILSFLSLTELGLSSAISYAMYKPLAEGDDETVSQILGYFRFLYKIIGFVMLTIGTLIVPFVPIFIKGNPPDELNIYVLYYIYLINVVISYFFAGYRQCLLNANQRIDITNTIGTGIYIFNNTFQILTICLIRNYYIYAVVPIVGTLITNAVNAYITRKMYPKISPKKGFSDEIKKEIKKRISGLIGSKLNSIIVNQADTIVISAFLGLTILADYGNYYYIMNSICGFIMVIFSSLTAGIGNKLSLDSIEENEKLFNNINFINAWIVGVCSVCFLCLFQPFMRLWVGKDLMLSMQFVILFVVNFFVYEIQRTVLTFKDAAGLWYEDRYRPYISIVVNVVSNLILVQVIGIYGIVLSTIIAFCISLPWANSILFNTLFKKSSIGNLIAFLKYGIVTIVVATISYLICSFSGNGVIGIVERLLISIIISNGLFVLIYHRRSEFIYMKDMFRNILKILR